MNYDTHSSTPSDYPTYLAIDASSYEDDGYPIAIAWSLPDGRIKTVLIQPEDDWEGWDYALADVHGITPDTLYQRGETCWSIVRELENDVSVSELFVEDTEQTQKLLEMIYEACGRELSMECHPCKNTSEGTHSPCDERVLLMLQQHA